MGRLILLLLIAGGFVVFAAQNLSPVALVVLGIKTQALPLSVWVLSFVAAGALTTLLLSGFFSLSKNAAVRQSTQRPSSKPSSPWSAATPNKTAGFTSGGAGMQDDWERGSSQDDWTEPQAQSSRPPENRPPVRDTPRDNVRGFSPDSRDTRSQSAPRDPGRSPIDQAGFSRREEPRKSSEVYDAEYRVLIPPYNSPPAAAKESSQPKEPNKPLDLPQKPTNPEDEDWV